MRLRDFEHPQSPPCAVAGNPAISCELVSMSLCMAGLHFGRRLLDFIVLCRSWQDVLIEARNPISFESAKIGAMGNARCGGAQRSGYPRRPTVPNAGNRPSLFRGYGILSTKVDNSHEHVSRGGPKHTPRLEVGRQRLRAQIGRASSFDADWKRPMAGLRGVSRTGAKCEFCQCAPRLRRSCQVGLGAKPVTFHALAIIRRGASRRFRVACTWRTRPPARCARMEPDFFPKLRAERRSAEFSEVAHVPGVRGFVDEIGSRTLIHGCARPLDSARAAAKCAIFVRPALPLGRLPMQDSPIERPRPHEGNEKFS
jgi:hypothetical protein